MKSLGVNSKIPDTFLQLWLSLLKPYRVEEIESDGTREYKILLPFAVLRQAIDESLPSYVEESTLEAMAESEWAALREQVRQFGVYRTPHCDNPTTASVVNMMGGWEAMCNMARGSCHTAAKILSSCGSIATDKSKQCSLGGNAHS